MIKYSEKHAQTYDDDLHEVWWQGRQWAVTAYGIEARDGSYPIEAKRIGEKRGKSMSDWVPHMAEKDWVDLPDFVTSLMVASILHSKPLPARMIWNGWKEAKKQRQFAVDAGYDAP